MESSWFSPVRSEENDPDFKLEGPQREARIRELEHEVQNLPNSKERTRKLGKLQELRRRPSRQAHGADKNKGSSKLSIIPIIPEAPWRQRGLSFLSFSSSWNGVPLRYDQTK